MFPNLEGERAKFKIKLADLAEAIGVTIGTMSLKLQGKYPITLDEAIKIKARIGTDMPIEELFSEEVV